MRLAALCLLSLAFACPVRADDGPAVLTDIPPVAALAARVMDRVGAPDMLYRPGMSPHHHALRPSDARAISRADVVFWIGPVMTPWLGRALEDLAAKSVVLMATDGVELLEARNGGHSHGDHDVEHGEGHDDHGDEETHDDHGDETDHGDHGHEDGHHVRTVDATSFATDPHIWLNPDNAAAMMRAMAEVLAAHDPANATRYRENAAAGAAELAAQAARIAAALEGTDPVFITGHDALHYFEHRFGAEMRAAISPSDDAAPGAAHLADLKADLAPFDRVCVVVEPGYALKLVDVVVPEARRKVVVLDHLAGSGVADWARYTQLLDEVARAIGACSE